MVDGVDQGDSMDTIRIFDGREVPAAPLLAALYNQSAPLGMGHIATVSAPTQLTTEKAQEILDELGVFRFDYLGGRPLKIRARDGVIDSDSERLYDRDNGLGAFERAVQTALRDE